ncbi:helix-turn-helix domain-containing protein [Streptomyces sp. NPDC048644]|uniref:helix-turn-helix domain-containing protein n=1 Tax=Streptomyces sp. NPDC048644 TaxID=3365582 RepID=UPI00371D2C0B
MTGRRYTYDEAAEALRVHPTWLRRHIKELPHSKKGRVVTFSEDDIERIDRQFHHEPVDSAPAAAPSSAAPHPLANLRPLPARSSLHRTRITA